MIFKFDRVGNMNMEGDIEDMAKKKDKFSQMDIGVVNQVKEEVLGMVDNHADEDAEMIQEMEKITREETAVGYESANSFEENSRSGEIINLGDKSMPSFGSLSEKMKNEESGGDDKEDEVRNEDKEVQNGKNNDEMEKKRELKKLKKEAKERLEKLNNSSEWKFENTVEICRNKESCKFQTIASAEFLGNLLDRKIAVYVGDLQRGWKNNSKNELVEVKSEKQIKLILDSLLHNRMHGGFITLNLNPSDGYEINYNEDDHTISGSISQKLQILDGNHRLNSFSRWVKLYKRNPESVPNPADYYISVVIETLNDDDAKSLFSEYCLKGLKISKSRGEYLNVEDYTNKLCRDVMKKSDLKVEVISTSIKATSENIISFGVLSKNIKDNYDPKTKMDVEEYGKHLITFVDAIIQTFPKFMASKDLMERKIFREDSLTMEALAWGGYFYISKSLQGKSKEEILSILSKFNSKVDYKGFIGNFLDKENPIFRKIMREGNKMISTSSSATWINKVFSEYILENKSLDEIGKEEAK